MLKMTANYKKKIDCILIAHEMKQNVFPSNYTNSGYKDKRRLVIWILCKYRRIKYTSSS